MRTLYFAFFCVAGFGAASAQSIGETKLWQARAECWARVGINGDTSDGRGSMAHSEAVARCVREKMRSRGNSKTKPA
jgi:hypothetical protein